VGIYIANAPNYAIQLVQEFSAAALVDVEQRWVCMKGTPPNKMVAAVTTVSLNEYVPKWQVVNELITVEDLDRFDYFAICDDDIQVGRGLLTVSSQNNSLYVLPLLNLPERGRSFTDHSIVRRRLFTRARQTSLSKADRWFLSQ